jgi:uncharacterized protein YbaR (Trm112 family)
MSKKEKKISTEGIICPECNEPLDEEYLAKSLVCPHCKTNLKDQAYMDFLEFLMAHDIVKEIDFFDMSLYGEEFMKHERNEMDDVDISEYEDDYARWESVTSDLSIDEEYIEDLNQQEEQAEESWKSLTSKDWVESANDENEDDPNPGDSEEKKDI